MQFRDEFQAAIYPVTFSGESAAQQKADSGSQEEAQLCDEYFARRKRLDSLPKTLKKLHEAKWKVEVILDENIGELLQPFSIAFTEL